ncbi:MAG TPA: hypothetical protein DCW44_02945 [Eubacterium sp.]|nr:hypothetical protein [Eubacterium sp.]
MELEYIVSLVTILVTFVLGIISKKNPKLSNKIIPIQNLFVGLIVAVIEFFITKDFKVAIALSGLIAGGTYDIVHNLNKLIKGDENNE